jgi:hypothetical protein
VENLAKDSSEENGRFILNGKKERKLIASHSLHITLNFNLAQVCRCHLTHTLEDSGGNETFQQVQLTAYQLLPQLGARYFG